MPQPEQFATILDKHYGLAAVEQQAMRERLVAEERLEIDVLVEHMLRTAEAEGRVGYRPTEDSTVEFAIGFEYHALSSQPGPGGPQTCQERLSAIAIERPTGTQLILTLTQGLYFADGSARQSLECDMSVQPDLVVIDDFRSVDPWQNIINDPFVMHATGLRMRDVFERRIPPLKAQPSG